MRGGACPLLKISDVKQRFGSAGPKFPSFKLWRKRDWMSRTLLPVSSCKNSLDVHRKSNSS